MDTQIPCCPFPPQYLISSLHCRASSSCPQSLLPPPPAPPPHPCLGTYLRVPELSLCPLWFPTASLSMNPRPSSLPGLNPRELSRKSDLISLLSSPYFWCWCTSPMRQDLQVQGEGCRGSSLMSCAAFRLCLQFTWGERKGSWGVFLVLNTSLAFKF